MKKIFGMFLLVAVSWALAGTPVQASETASSTQTLTKVSAKKHHKKKHKHKKHIAA